MATRQERFPRTTPELYRQMLPANWMGVFDLMLLRLAGQAVTAMGRLNSGEMMTVMLPEGISSIIYFMGDYEPEVTKAMQQLLRPGMSVCNVGAHIGLRVVQASKLVGRGGQVSAFEPTDWSRNLLKQNSENRLAEVLIFSEAVGSSNGEEKMSTFGILYGGLNTLAGKSRHGSVSRADLQAEMVNVRVIKLDSLVGLQMRNPDLLVLDTEGYEEAVLLGARNLLSREKPMIIFETGDLNGGSTIAVMSILNTLGYSFFEIGDDGVLRGHQQRVNYPENGNLIAIHPQATRGTL